LPADGTLLVIDVNAEIRPAVLGLIGELDAETAGTLTAHGQALVAAGHRRLVLDCAGLTFCDSFGLRTMNDLWNSVQPDGSVTIAFASDHLNRLLQITGLFQKFAVDGARRD
jgi:anti-sigma B factor antagonist